MVILFLRRLFRCLLISERGSLVIEGVVIFPIFLFLVFSFMSIITYFSTSSYIRQRVDSYGSYVCCVGDAVGLSGGVGEVGSVSGSSLVDMFSNSYLKAYLLEGGVLEDKRLKVISNFDGGYLTVRVEYGLDMVLLGRVVVVDFYERRLW